MSQESKGSSRSRRIVDGVVVLDDEIDDEDMEIKLRTDEISGGKQGWSRRQIAAVVCLVIVLISIIVPITAVISGKGEPGTIIIR